MERQGQEKIQQVKQLKNALRTKKTVEIDFPNERWINAATVKFKHTGEDFDLPISMINIKVAQSRLTGQKNDERVLVKEIEQAKILADKGSSVFLLPKLKDPNGKLLAGPDAIVNGTLFEFKTIRGPIRKIERHFRKSRKQSINSFLRIMRPDISKSAVMSKLRRVLNDPTYTGGTKGKLVFHLEGTKKTYFFWIKNVK